MTLRAPTPFGLRAWALAILLAGAALCAASWRAEIQTTDALTAPDLEAMIPHRFGAWRALPEAAPQVLDPRVSERVGAIYADTLARVYRHDDGSLIMLSIAYGSRQLDDGEQAHRPEFCYTAQGFTIEDTAEAIARTGHDPLPVRQLLARRGPRVEPITYWLTIGRHAALPGLTRKLQQLRYGLSGEVPDGVLIRVSSLDPDAKRAWQIHEGFIRALLQSLSPEHRERISGTGHATT